MLHSRTPRFMFLTIVATVSALLVISNIAFATSDSETEEALNVKTYGSCTVSTRVDLFTDKKTYSLVCMEESAFDMTSIGIHKPEGPSAPQIWLSKGLMLILDETIPIVLRIDRGEVIKGNWIWNGQSDAMAAVYENSVLAENILSQIATGSKVLIMVGDEKGAVDLSDVARAVADFRSRIKEQ